MGLMWELHRILDIEQIAKKLAANQDWARRHETRSWVNDIIKGVLKTHYGEQRYSSMPSWDIDTLIEDIRHHIVHNTQH